MEKILFLNACVRPESRTLTLAKYALSFLHGAVEEVDLEQAAIRSHTRASLARREELLAAGRTDDPMFRWANQFKQADTIVIAAPYYDLSFPSSLKNYLEAICNVGVTFYYDDQDQPQTLCRGKRLIYVSTSGADFLPDFGFCYVKRLFSEFFHIDEAVLFYAERLDLQSSDPEQILRNAREEIRKAMTT